MKKLLTIAILLLLQGTMQAQSLAGDWKGVLAIPGPKNIKLRIVLHISENGGVYTTTMDSPDQSVLGLPTDKTVVRNDSVTIEASKLSMKYSGTFQPDSNKIEGTFMQGPGSIKLSLYKITEAESSKASEVKSNKRSQDPLDYPYHQEEITFRNNKAGIQLAGTLTMPENKKVVKKIVILISGSGPQDRNEEIVQFNHRPFLVWSDWLTRQGIAVLRYDDRGVGKSTGNFGTSTSADFADDARAAVNYIRSRADLANLSVGLAGHSEGGLIAPMVAANNKAVDFVVLLAAPGIPIEALMLRQTADQMRLMGAPNDAITGSSAVNKKLYQELNSYKDLDTEAAKTKIDSVLYQELSKLSAGSLSKAEIEKQAMSQSVQLTNPWFRYFISFDPSMYLSKLKCPVLAINGTLDMQVSSTENLQGISNSLKNARNTHFETVPLTGLNHLFQPAKTGAVSEYAQIEETVSPLALAKVADWINKL